MGVGGRTGERGTFQRSLLSQNDGEKASKEAQKELEWGLQLHVELGFSELFKIYLNVFFFYIIVILLKNERFRTLKPFNYFFQERQKCVRR